jgi:hypothetical protein
VAESMRMWVSMAVCRALSSRRSPPRLILCLMVLPEDAGIGLTPARLANAASERTRPSEDQAANATAAVMGPMPG